MTRGFEGVKRVTLEFHASAEGVSGWLEGEQARRQPFSGWLQLMAELQEIADPDAPSGHSEPVVSGRGDDSVPLVHRQQPRLDPSNGGRRSDEDE